MLEPRKKALIQRRAIEKWWASGGIWGGKVPKLRRLKKKIGVRDPKRKVSWRNSDR